MKISLIQNGSDGIGHQLLGLFSCMVLHGVNDICFDGQAFLSKSFKCEHLQQHDSKSAFSYMKEIVKLFIELEKCVPNDNIKRMIQTSLNDISYQQDVLYMIDNAYNFKKICFKDTLSRERHNINIDKYRSLLINEHLPTSRLCENNIVVHIRQGDAMRYKDRRISLLKHQSSLIQLIPYLHKLYENHQYYVHTDGDATFLTNELNKHNITYKCFVKNEPIMNVLSDFIHSKVFITSSSALSLFCTFAENHELTIIPDDTVISTPDTCIKISEIMKRI